MPAGAVDTARTGVVGHSFGSWNALVLAGAREGGLVPPAGLWEPLGDARFLAVMALGPEGFDLTGPAGLAGVGVPLLLVGAGADEMNDYVPATTELFAHLPDADLITFLGARHLWVFVPDAQAHLRRFALAFFEVHLHGGTGWAEVLSEAFVGDVAPTLGGRNGFEGLAWGVAGAGPGGQR